MPSYRSVPVDGFTEVTVDGDLDVESSRALLTEIARDADVVGQHLLIDLRDAKADLDFREIYRLVKGLAAHSDVFSGRIALLDRYDERFMQTQFFEAVATDHGFEVRSFIDESRAVAWLES